MEGVQKTDVTEVNELLEDFFQSESEQEPEQEPVVESQPETETEPETETVPTEEPEAEPEPELEPEPVAVEPDEVTSLREQNKALLEHVEKLSGHVVGGAIVAPKPEQPEAQQTAMKPPAGQLPNFLGNLTIDDILESPEKLNEVLARVYQAAQENSVQQTLRSVPELVVGYITRHTAMNRMVDDFYREHPDLSGVKQTVAAVANTVHSENPDWSVDKVFSETAGRTRKLLGLKAQAQASTKPLTKKPAFAKPRGARKEEPQLSGIQKEINDLLTED